jgi:hypothetical protein
MKYRYQSVTGWRWRWLRERIALLRRRPNRKLFLALTRRLDWEPARRGRRGRRLRFTN